MRIVWSVPKSKITNLPDADVLTDGEIVRRARAGFLYGGSRNPFSGWVASESWTAGEMFAGARIRGSVWSGQRYLEVKTGIVFAGEC